MAADSAWCGNWRVSPGNCLRGDLEARVTLTYDAAHSRWWPGSSERAAIATLTRVPSHYHYAHHSTSLISGSVGSDVVGGRQACAPRGRSSFTERPGRRARIAQARTCVQGATSSLCFVSRPRTVPGWAWARRCHPMPTQRSQGRR